MYMKININQYPWRGLVAQSVKARVFNVDVPGFDSRWGVGMYLHMKVSFFFVYKFFFTITEAKLFGSEMSSYLLTKPWKRSNAALSNFIWVCLSLHTFEEKVTRPPFLFPTGYNGPPPGMTSVAYRSFPGSGSVTSSPSPPPTMPGRECKFCKNNGETTQMYRGVPSNRFSVASIMVDCMSWLTWVKSWLKSDILTNLLLNELRVFFSQLESTQVLLDSSQKFWLKLSRMSKLASMLDIPNSSLALITSRGKLWIENLKWNPLHCRSHSLRNPSDGRLICPVLRDHVCDMCGATGDDAHTRYGLVTGLFIYHSETWVGLTCILDVPLSAQFGFGWWEFGRKRGAARQTWYNCNIQISVSPTCLRADETPCTYRVLHLVDGNLLLTLK